MTFGICMIKGLPDKRDSTLNRLYELSKHQKFGKGVIIDRFFITFGWPDFVIIFNAPNVELIKDAIVRLRKELLGLGDKISTSTLICITKEESEKKLNEFSRIVD